VPSVEPQAPDLLARRYRRWLLAYPADYRRERGDELIGTLLDLAGPGRARPHPLDVLDLLRAGLARRLRQWLLELLVPPRRRGNGQIMAFVAFAVGCLVPVVGAAMLLFDGAGDGSWRTTLVHLPVGIPLAPLLAWLGVTARTRLRRAVVAALMTTGCALEPSMAGVWANLALAEWLAVLWFRPAAVVPAYVGGQLDA
jgi:hypothetical protein